MPTHTLATDLIPLLRVRGVLGAEGMSAYAVRFPGGHGRRRRFASQMVYEATDRLKVPRVAAPPDATEMVKLQAIGDGSANDLVHDPMDREGFRFVDCRAAGADKAVAVVVGFAEVNPARTKVGAVVRQWTALINARPQTFFERPTFTHDRVIIAEFRT